MRFAIKLIAICVTLTGGSAAFSQNSQAPLPVVAAEVRKVDAEAQRLTLRHEAIPNVDMGPMTMVFRVRDAALLHQLKAGDKVRVTVDRVEGALTVISLASDGPAALPTEKPAEK